jgi:L-lactate dehydrogenase complex protein LldG
MSSDLETFESSAAGPSTVHRTTADAFEETLEEAVATPAVGVPLPFEGVGLAETPVETDFAPSDLTAAETGVTPVGLGVADYGSVTVESTANGAELVSLYPPRHVAVLAASDIEPDMPAALDTLEAAIADDGRSRVLATGPSSTADMGTLVQGVHGPKAVHVVVLEDR